MKKGLILLFLVFSCCSCNTNKDWGYPTKFDSKKTDNYGHPYRDVNLNRNLTIQNALEKDLGDKSAYKIERVLGNGTFGSVFKAIHSPTQDAVALKVLLHSNENVISKEVNILRELKDAPNFLPLRDVLKEVENGEVTIGLVTDFFPGQNFERLLPKLNAYEMKVIVYETIRTIEYAHSKGIMHRDIKPLNVLMIPGGEVRARVIDWGQAEYYAPTRKLGTKVSTLYYKAPELLLGYPKYDYSIDVWSTGCMLAEMAFRKYHFFTGDKEAYPRGPDFFSKESKLNFLRGQLDAIASIFGTQSIKAYADKFKNDMEDYDMIDYIREHDGTSLARFIDETNFDMVDPLLIDLLYKMLTIDHTKRITMKEALTHPYFDEVRDQ